MPILSFKCECGNKVETIQPIGFESPKCEKCGGKMVKQLTAPAVITIKNGCYPIRSRGYNNGYSKKFLKDIHPETQ